MSYVFRVVLGSVALLAAISLWACGSDSSDRARTEFENTQPQTSAALPPGHPPIGEPTPAEPGGAAITSTAGVAWNLPKGWEAQGPRTMRVATYTIHTNREGTAECAVYFFGTGQGGDVQANIDRWINQFQQADGSPSSGHASTSHAQQSGWALTTVDVSGTYTGGMGPMSGNQEPQPGYRMLAAIIEGPEGPVFFKLTGPQAVVEASEADFTSLLQSLHAAT
jgi:hypothetical protein